MTLCIYPNCQEPLKVHPGGGRQKKYCQSHRIVMRDQQNHASNEKRYWPNGRPVKKDPAHIIRQVERRIYRNGRGKGKVRMCKLENCGKPAGEGYQDYCTREHNLRSFEKYKVVA